MNRNTHATVTGLFVLLLVIAGATIVYWLGHFEKEQKLYVISTHASVTGLNPQSTVFFRGIAVGKVLSIQFDPDNAGIILVPIEINHDIVLTKGVYATLQLKGVTGLTQINLEDAGEISQRLPTGNNPLTRIPLMPSLTDKLLDSGEELLKKADHLMVRVGAILNDENQKNIGDTLTNLKTATGKLSDLQKSIDKALIGIPELTKDARLTLTQINALTHDLQGLSAEVKRLTQTTHQLAKTGQVGGDLLLQTTLPKFNALLTDMQSSATALTRLTNTLENNPQALLLGPNLSEPGPGEPGFKDAP